MPRPKVLPSQRQRAVEACNACRSTKKRCSGTVPCTQCQKRGLQDTCFLTVQQARPSTIERRATLKTSNTIATVPIDTIDTTQLPLPTAKMTAGHLRTVEELPVSPPDGASLLSDVLMGDSQGPAGQDSRSTSRANGRWNERSKRRTSSTSTASIASTDARMLFNQRGERVYIGSAASISFLQVLRRVVSDQIGPSPFSHNDKAETMLEKASPDQKLNEVASPPAFLPEISVVEKQDFARCCFSVTEGFMDIFDAAEVDSLLGISQANSPMVTFNPMKKACGNLIIAIGSQCKSISTAQSVALPYFREAQRLVVADMWEDPDQDMVRAHLLMSFYLLGECRRNAAFMYLGIATRAALALGLHSRDSYSNMSSPADRLRLRLWMSVKIMDKLVNSILGRPAATAGVYSDMSTVFEAFNATNKTPAAEALCAAHGIVSIINDITRKVYEKKEITVRVVEQFLDDIETWKRGLPVALSNSAPMDVSGTPSSQGSGGSLGNVHVSCLYYFAVALVTRPILVSGLTSKPTFGTQPAQLAGACLDAATFLAETCVEAYRSGLLQTNMCIMKALLFAAGLILGFEIFTKRSIDHEVEAAFTGTTDVLGFLATSSPQAAHYLDILTSLSNAALKRKASTRKNRYVSRIFSVGSATAEPPRLVEPQSWEESLFMEDLPPLQGEDVDNGWASLGQVSGEGLSLDWDTLNISQWDSFPFQGTL